PAHRAAHLVVPPLAGAGGVAVPEAEQRVVLVEGGHRPEAGALDVAGDIAAPRRKEVTVVAHRGAVHRNDVVDAPQQILRAPWHEPHSCWYVAFHQRFLPSAGDADGTRTQHAVWLRPPPPATRR